MQSGNQQPSKKEFVSRACEDLSFVSITLARCIVEAQIHEGHNNIANEDSKLGSADEFTEAYFNNHQLLGHRTDLGSDIFEILGDCPEDMYVAIGLLCEKLIESLNQKFQNISLKANLRRSSGYLSRARYFEDQIIQLASVVQVRTSLELVSRKGFKAAAASPHLLAAYGELVLDPFNESRSRPLDSKFKLLLQELEGLTAIDLREITVIAQTAQIEGDLFFTNRTITPGGALNFEDPNARRTL